MAQNTSSAVMQQRREPHDSLEDFPTPPWATRALCRYIAQYSSRRLGEMTCREPCANRGYMVRPLREHFASVDAFDVHDYGAGFPVRDFLFPVALEPVDWTFMNPPFRLAEQFIARALETSTEGVAVIVRSAFLEGETRHRELFSKTPPSHVVQFAERVVMLKGRLIRSGDPDPSPENPDKKAGTATAYCGLIWFQRRQGPVTFDWIPKCRLELERPGDYPAEAA